MTDGVYVCRGVNREFQAFVRLRGHRKYCTVGKSRLHAEMAYVDLAKAMALGSCKRGYVCMTADYYDPIIVVEMVTP